MAGYCTSVQSYFHKSQASENTAQEEHTIIMDIRTFAEVRGQPIMVPPV